MNLESKNILKEIEEWLKCSNINDYTIIEKIKFHEEYLGYIHITTDKEEDRRKLLILEVNPLISKYGNIWAYAITTMSIGSGKKSRLTIWSKVFEKNPLSLYDVVYANKIEKGPEETEKIRSLLYGNNNVFEGKASRYQDINHIYQVYEEMALNFELEEPSVSKAR